MIFAPVPGRPCDSADRFWLALVRGSACSGPRRRSGLPALFLSRQTCFFLFPVCWVFVSAPAGWLRLVLILRQGLEWKSDVRRCSRDVVEWLGAGSVRLRAPRHGCAVVRSIGAESPPGRPAVDFGSVAVFDVLRSASSAYLSHLWDSGRAKND